MSEVITIKHRPISGTPTMIRHYSKPEYYKGVNCHLVGIVTSVSTAEAFTAHFHVHRVFPNGKGSLLHSGGEWTHERGATEQWDKWKKEIDNDHS